MLHGHPTKESLKKISLVGSEYSTSLLGRGSMVCSKMESLMEKVRSTG